LFPDSLAHFFVDWRYGPAHLSQFLSSRGKNDSLSGPHDVRLGVIIFFSRNTICVSGGFLNRPFKVGAHWRGQSFPELLVHHDNVSSVTVIVLRYESLYLMQFLRTYVRPSVLLAIHNAGLQRLINLGKSHHTRRRSKLSGEEMTKQTIGVIGSGLMGSGIAQACAVAGISVIVRDIDEGALKRGMDTISSSLARLVSKEKMTDEAKTVALSLIKTTTDLRDFSEADFIIEAATENLALKQKILQEVETIAAPSCIIATNTSSVSITKLAATLANPGRFVGMHFFNPVPVMALVEIIRAIQTTDATFAATEDLARRVGKTPIGVKNAPGFVVNRILCPMINEAIFVLQEGLAAPEEIDAGMKLGANHPIGPLALADLVGLDTLLAVMNVFYADFKDPKYRPAPLLQEMVDAGYLGRKSGRGFYSY
jgi:3-hydroxybutyryl-CoA dehydrogenase